MISAANCGPNLGHPNVRFMYVLHEEYSTLHLEFASRIDLATDCGQSLGRPTTLPREYYTSHVSFPMDAKSFNKNIGCLIRGRDVLETLMVLNTFQSQRTL